MQEIFIRILLMGIAANYLIAAVLVLRALFGKAPKWIACFLWLLVGLRLICPVRIESSFSFVPQSIYAIDSAFESGQEMQQIQCLNNALTYVRYKAFNSHSGTDRDFAGGKDSFVVGNGAYGMNAINSAGKISKNEAAASDRDNTAKPDNTPEGETTVAAGNSGDEKSGLPAAGWMQKAQIINILTFVWLGGLIVMLSYLIISYSLICRRVSAATILRKNIYECEFVDSPFILGIVRPRIYIPYHMDEEKLLPVLAHENAHLKRKDHIFKLAAFLILCVYWFSPLVWLSYVLLCRDIEMACDERVVKSMKKEEKKGYLLALLECSVNRGRTNVCPLAFGEIGIKERVMRVKKFKKPPVWLIIIVFIVCVAVSVGFLTNPKRGGNEAELSQNDAAATSDENNRGQDIEPEKEREREQEETKKEEQEQDLYKDLVSRYRTDNGGDKIKTGAGLWLGFGMDKKKGRFSFGNDPLSSYLSVGNYNIKDGIITCYTDDGMYHYSFKIGEDNTLIFIQDLSSKVQITDERVGTRVVDGTVFYPEINIDEAENIDVKSVEVSQLDFSQDASGSDGVQLYYADGKKIIFSGWFGLFVYDVESGKITASLDLAYIGCNYTQGDTYCEIFASRYGDLVYLQPASHTYGAAETVLYIFDTENITLKKLGYDKKIWEDPSLDLFRVRYSDADNTAKAEYEGDDGERVCILYRGGFGVIGNCSFVDYPKNGKGATQYSPFFKPEGYERAEEFGAEDIHDIVELKICDDGVISEIRDADALRQIEGFLSNAQKTGELVIGEVPGSWPTFNNHPNNGNLFCKFTNPIYIKRSDGVRGIIWPAEDECNVYISGKGFYQMNKGSDRGLWHLLAGFTKKSHN